MADLHENEYLTIKHATESLFKDKGSKFLAYAIPFEDDSLLKETLEPIKKEHYNARHFCFAYRINPENIAERANDDGEPGHTAGTPILGQIHSLNLVNVLVVVVRYFGGTKLGVSGLINAYKTAAKEALENATIVKKEIESDVKIAFDYADMNEVMRVIKKEEPRIINQNMNLCVEMTLRMRKDKIIDFSSQLELLKSITFIAI